MNRHLPALALLVALPLIAAEPASPSSEPACCRKVVTNSPPTERSLYQLESRWTSDLGKTVRLGVFRGRPVVLALFFTQCEFACPIIVHDMQRVAAAVPEPLRGKVDFVLVSLDTERDTVEALRAYRERQKLPPANWLLLRGTADDVRELAALLGVTFQKDARGQFAHSNLITVLNPEGEVAHQLVGLNQPVADTARIIERLLKP